ncbi:MAG TPA: hypothetical protein VFS07_05575, partial [Gemmatimonadales bacterium]|nr:hypothetical protein [Gemmatimonadales bacterium]
MTLPLVPGVLPAEVVAALAQAAALRLPPEVVYDLVRRQVERMVETDAFYLALWEPRTERIHF